jgi:hypothetical protein
MAVNCNFIKMSSLFREQFAFVICLTKMVKCEAFKSPCLFFPVMNAFLINTNKRQFLDFGMELMVFESFVFITFHIFLSRCHFQLTIRFSLLKNLSWHRSKWSCLNNIQKISLSMTRFQKNHITNSLILTNDRGRTYSLVFRISNVDFEPDTMRWNNVNQSIELFLYTSILHYNRYLGQLWCASCIHAFMHSFIRWFCAILPTVTLVSISLIVSA